MSIWLPRVQQIFAAEAFAALALPPQHAELLRGRDIVWFIDNLASCSSLIRGGSAQEDVEQIALASHLLLMVLGCRVWFEWVDSGSNPADGLSRDGLDDCWTVKQGWNLSEGIIPGWAYCPLPAVNFAQALIQHWEAKGL